MAESGSLEETAEVQCQFCSRKVEIPKKVKDILSDDKIDDSKKLALIREIWCGGAYISAAVLVYCNTDCYNNFVQD